MVRLISLIFLMLSFTFGESSLMPNEKETIGRYIPNITLEDQDGRRFKIRDLNKVIILNPIYTRCTSACPIMTEGLKRALYKMKEDVLILSLSFDTRDRLEDLRRFKELHGLPENWYVVRSEEVQELLKAIDYKHVYNEGLGVFDHPNLYVIITPEGKVSRYIYGVSPRLRDLRLAVLEAKKESGKLSPVEGVWLRCFRFNRETGSYQLDWFFIFDVIGGLLTFLVVPALVWGKDGYGFIVKGISHFLVKNS